MRRASWHRFQVSTKRSDRLAELRSRLEWTPNIWMGVSVENDKYRFRIDNLRSTGAHVKFLSLEPLLGPLTALRSAREEPSTSATTFTSSHVTVWFCAGRRLPVNC
jgi:protein gp37